MVYPCTVYFRLATVAQHEFLNIEEYYMAIGIRSGS